MANRRELGDDILAVAAFFDHADYACELALRATQPIKHGRHLVWVKFDHG
jgi:hypothetical protein